MVSLYHTKILHSYCILHAVHFIATTHLSLPERLYLLISHTYFSPPPTPLPYGEHLFVLCIYDWFLFCHMSSFVLLFKFHI